MWMDTLELVSTRIYFHVINVAVGPRICTNPNHGFPKYHGMDTTWAAGGYWCWTPGVTSRMFFIMGGFRFKESRFTEVSDSFAHFVPQNYLGFFLPLETVQPHVGLEKQYPLRVSKEVSPPTGLWKDGQGLKQNPQTLKPVKLSASQNRTC